MIFNPFDIQNLSQAVQQGISLSWAPMQLQDNIPLVLLVLLYLIIDLLAWHPKGVLVHQLAWLNNTRNARTFEASAVIYPWLKPFLLMQYFIFFGLSILLIYDHQLAEHFANPTPAFLGTLLLCLAIPTAWYLLHLALFNWFCYLFNLRNRQIIMNRCYSAAHIILAPVSTLIFICILTGLYPSATTLILLATLFFLSQIVFIFNGFKIFCVNLYTFLMIFVYLCTLEIAPLLVIYAKYEEVITAVP